VVIAATLFFHSLIGDSEGSAAAHRPSDQPTSESDAANTSLIKNPNRQGEINLFLVSQERMDRFPTWALKEGRNSDPKVNSNYLIILTCGAFGYDASNVDVSIFKQLIHSP
jgi:hypothetical protein